MSLLINVSLLNKTNSLFQTNIHVYGTTLNHFFNVHANFIFLY